MYVAVLVVSIRVECVSIIKGVGAPGAGPRRYPQSIRDWGIGVPATTNTPLICQIAILHQLPPTW